MKNLLLAASVLVFSASVAFADSTSGPSYSNSYLDKYLSHTHQYDKYDHDNEAGAGVDVLLYDDDNIDLVQEYKYDFSNDSHATYTVVKTKVSVFSLVKGWLGK